MTTRQTATYGTGAALLVAWLAAANMPSQESDRPQERDARPAATVGTESLATEVGSQAARLRSRMTQAPVPDNHPRNPFAFGAARRTLPAAEAIARAAVAPDPAPALPPLPALTLMGIAEETSPQGPRRTAVIGGDRDTIFMVTEGEPVGDRYKVTKIGVDAVELEDIVTHGYRRIALR